jgi:hypothetical protein
MYKKLFSLVLVLALAGLASAASQWNGSGGGGVQQAWETGAWNPAYPVAGDTTVKLHNVAGSGCNISVSSGVSGGVKPQMMFSVCKLEILSGGTITNSGSWDIYQNTSADITIRSGGEIKFGTTTGVFKVSGETGVAGASIVVVNVYGTLTGKGTTNSSLAVCADTRGTGVHSGTVNIYNGGVVNVDAYAIGLGTYGTGKIKIRTGGMMKIKGNVTTQVSADIIAGRIAPVGRVGLMNYYKAYDNTTYVPEPATIAMLGLGSLLFCRKKR